MKIGDRVEMTASGRLLAERERRVAVRPGVIRDIFDAGRRNEQVYVCRDGGGCEWWPVRAWSCDASSTSPSASEAPR